MTTTASTSRRSSSSGPTGVDADGGWIAGSIRIRCSTRADGDFHRTAVPWRELEARRRALVDLPWTMLDEHHGTRAVRVDRPGAHDGARGDIAVTDRDGAVLGCWAGDCAPIVLIGAGSNFAVVHAGWRGLAAGVVDRAVEALAEPLRRALLGPTIGPCCYEFGAEDAGAVAAAVGAAVDTITAPTPVGTLALDVPAAIEAACARHGVGLERLAGCTGCAYPGYSHRVNGDPGRHVLAAWRPPTGDR